MLTMPAKVAGVERIAVVTPPNPEGKAEYTRRLELFERKKPLRFDRNPRPAAKPAEKPAKPN